MKRRVKKAQRIAATASKDQNTSVTSQSQGPAAASTYIGTHTPAL
jgi:hypothetical protein